MSHFDHGYSSPLGVLSQVATNMNGNSFDRSPSVVIGFGVGDAPPGSAAQVAEPCMVCRRGAERMDLSFQAGLAENYSSTSQKIRVLSESWFATQVCCPNCGREKLRQYQSN